MSATYSLVNLKIDCTIPQAEHIRWVIETLERELPEWLIAPASISDLEAMEIPTIGTKPQWVRQLMVNLASYLMDTESEGFSFTPRMAFHIPANPPAQFTGLTLEGDQVNDDIFETAHQILRALDSQQTILTGIAYTSDTPDEFAYSGNLASITRRSWSFMFDENDVSAFVTEHSQNLSYWLVTYGPEAASTPNTFLWTSSLGTTELDNAKAIIGQLEMPGHMEPSDLNLTSITGPVFRSIMDAIPVHIDRAFASSITPNSQESVT